MFQESYKNTLESGDFHKRLVFPGGETVVIHSPQVIVHFPASAQPDAWGNTTVCSDCYLQLYFVNVIWCQKATWICFLRMPSILFLYFSYLFVFNNDTSIKYLYYAPM